MKKLTLNIKDFNAIGNGITDNTQAFQNAIAALPNGGTIFVPDGNYIVNTIVLKEGITLLGNGMNSQITLNSDSKEEALITNELTNNSKQAIDIHIKNLFLWSDSKKEETKEIDAIKLKSTYFSSVENCKISNFSGSGIRMTAYRSDDNTKKGDSYNTNYVKDCIIYNNKQYGIFADGDGADFHIQGGDIGSNKNHNILLFSPSSSVTGVKAIWGSKGGDGIYVASGNIQIVGNNIEGNNKNGINVTHDNCFIEGNKIYLNNDSGILIKNNKKTPKNTSILSNQLMGALDTKTFNPSNGTPYAIINNGDNTYIYSNAIINKTYTTQKTLNAVNSSNKFINSDFNWIKDDLQITLENDFEVIGRKSNQLPLNSIENPEYPISNNAIVPKYLGKYMLNFSALLKDDFKPRRIKISDSYGNVYLVSTSVGETLNFSRDIYLDKAICFYIESDIDLTISKDNFHFSIKKVAD